MQTRRPSLAKREWLPALLVVLVAIALTLIPYTLGYALARPGLEFTGIIMNLKDSGMVHNRLTL